MASSYLTKENAKAHLICGSGAVASELPFAYKNICPIEKTLIYDDFSKEGAKGLVAKLIKQGINAQLCEDIEKEIAEVDIISCATLSTAPIIQGKWLKNGQHIDLIGSFRPDMREADNETIAKSKIYIDTNAALEESGDLITPINSGFLTIDQIKSDLFALCKRKGMEKQSQ